MVENKNIQNNRINPVKLKVDKNTEKLILDNIKQNHQEGKIFSL